jgi:hypothetical protein
MYALIQHTLVDIASDGIAPHSRRNPYKKQETSARWLAWHGIAWHGVVWCGTYTAEKSKETKREGDRVGPAELRSISTPPPLLQAKHILIAVGGTPKKLDIPGAELSITSDEALELPKAPRKLTVLGAGYIAVEFAGIFQRFGSEVHVAFRQDLPLRGFDEEV